MQFPCLDSVSFWGMNSISFLQSLKLFGLPLEAAPLEEWVLRGEKTGLVFSVPGLVPSYAPMMATCSCTVMRQDSVLTLLLVAALPVRRRKANTSI